MFDIFVLGHVLLVEVVKVEVLVGCLVRLVLWCSNGRGDFLCPFSLVLPEKNGMSLGACLFGMVIWEDCFVILEHNFLGKMASADVVMELFSEAVVVEAVDPMQVGFFFLFQAWLFGEYDRCESDDGGCAWGGGDRVVEGVNCVGKGFGASGVDNRGIGVMSSGGNVTVAGGGARWRDC